MAVRLSGGRASIINAQAVEDAYGTTLPTIVGEPGTAYKPLGAIGCSVYCVNAEARLRLDTSASTALTGPQSAYLESDGTYNFALNPGVSYLSLMTIRGGTACGGTVRINWILGAGD